MPTSFPAPPSRPLFPGWVALLLLWLALSLALIAFAWPAITGLRATDPDDYMRLAEVRDWIAGQSWFDVRQHRMGLPPGADMHWSRLVDLPIATLLYAAHILFAEPAASAVAMALIPLVELLVAMILLHRLMPALKAPRAAALAAAALPLLFPLLISNFMPMRIDHHAWQAICALGCMLALRRPGWHGAFLAGLIAGLWLTISLEGLALVFAVCGILAWRTLRTGEPALAAFCAATATSGTLLGLATRTFGALLVPHPDQLSWPHLAAFAATALTALPASRAQSTRLVVLALAALAAASVLLAGLGPAALDPFHALDPVVRHLWLENIPEGLSFAHQDWQTRAALIWTPLIVLAGLRLALQTSPDPRGWIEQALLALAACALSFVLMRSAVAAQLLTVPFSALLLVHLFPRAAALPRAIGRVPAMLACLVLLTPSLASATGRWADHYFASPVPLPLRPTSALQACNLSTLTRLPASRILATLDLGPEILVRTQHRVVAGSYHRNSAAMRAVIEVFSGDPTRAHALARSQAAELLAYCPGSAEAGIYAARRPDNLANTLAKGSTVAWLQPLPGYDSGLQVYRIH